MASLRPFSLIPLLIAGVACADITPPSSVGDHAVLRRDAGNPAVTPKVSEHPRTFCNPLNLDYRIRWGEPLRREAADPVALYFKGDYYLFASKSGGYWHSPDFNRWTLVTPKNLPLENYAPTVIEHDGALYFMTSHGDVIYRSENPKDPESWKAVGPVRGNADPALFRDDDGRVYLYFGCSGTVPISVVELDPKNAFKEIGKPVELLRSDTKHHGWEVPGHTNLGNVHGGKRGPWMEGSWMTKHDGKYFLQYAAPGSEFDTYGDGVYESSSPLGPFTYAARNPFSFKPTGFMTGAGHSCTFTDANKNFWHIATGIISVRHLFERRLGLYPVGFDSAGRMFCDTRLGDLPQFLPGKAPAGNPEHLAGWMVLSYGKKASASSSLPTETNPEAFDEFIRERAAELSVHTPDRAFDESIKSYWSAATGNAGEWLQVDLGGVKSVCAVQVNFAEQDIPIRSRSPLLAQRYKIEYAVREGEWKVLADKSGNTLDAPHDYLEFESAVSVRYLRITNAAKYPGKFAIREFRVFGTAGGEKPQTGSTPVVTRDASDRRAATVKWPEVKGADGYIVRFGPAKDALHLQFEVRDKTELTLHCLNTDSAYGFAVEPFNENGVGAPSATVEVP